MRALAIAGLVLLSTLLVVAFVPGLRRAASNLLPRTWQVALVGVRGGFTADHSLRITMPDGTGLAASLYLPRKAQDPLPTILVRLPYGRLDYSEGYGSGMFFAKRGYAVLVEELRGTGDSGGTFLPWRDAAGDGAATLDWIVRQPWSNGKVGTFGCSALGETQLVLGKLNHPAHAAMLPSGAGGAIGTLQRRYGYFGLYEGGVFQLASGFGFFSQWGSHDPDAPPARPFDVAQELRRLPTSGLVANVRPGANGWRDFLATPLGHPRWEEWGYLTDADHISVPAFIINTWGDQTVGDALAMAEYQRLTTPAAARDQRVLIAPRAHCQHEESQADTASARGAPAGGIDLHELYVRWFDHWLRGAGEGLADFPAYTYYMIGADRWFQAGSWPPETASLQRWHLSSGGRANTANGSGAISRSPPDRPGADTFAYDPMNPVPSRGGPLCCTGDPKDIAGTVDQRDVEARDDVLVYTSPPLSGDLRIAGPLRAVLTASSDAPDTDLVVRLVDVHPDGRAYNVQEGALRMRYRAGVPAQLMEAGKRYTVSVDLRSIAYLLPAGHRLRLDVTSSSFPRLERNLNTGGDNARETASRVARNTLHHGPGIEAYLELPVIPAPQDQGSSRPELGL